MRDPDEMNREELLAEIDAESGPVLRRAALRCTTAELRSTVRAGREQVALYAQMGLKDAGAPQG